MTTGRFVGAAAVLAALGAGVYLAAGSGSADPGAADPTEVSIRSVPSEPAAPPTELPPVALVDLETPLPPATAETFGTLENFLTRFDGIWAEPQQYEGLAYRRALVERDEKVAALAEELAARREEMLPAVDQRIVEPGTFYPRQIFLAQALRAMNTTESLAALARIAGGDHTWRLRSYTMLQLSRAEAEIAVPVVVSAAKRLDDARLIVLLFKSEWEEKEVEVAYRHWAELAGSQTRNQSYPAMYNAEGAWMDVYLREVTAGDAPSMERAGSVNALAARNAEGVLYFFEERLWVETEERVIKALLAAIRKVGGDEGLRILAEYSASQEATEAMRAYAQAVLESPERSGKAFKPGDPGGPTLGATPNTRPGVNDDLRRKP